MNVTEDFSKYDFLYLTIGAGMGNYGSAILPVSMFYNNSYGKKTMYAYVLSGQGVFNARGAFDGVSTPNSIKTTSTDYPVSLYGIKMN